jgi:hypothetical protein
MRTSIGLTLCVIALTSCAHPNRISRSALQRLTRTGQPFILVFGSVLTPPHALARPGIRFVHKADRASPEYLLASLTILNGDRFYAVLDKPRDLPRIDEFFAEVGSEETGFDKITYIRLSKDDSPLAMYVGDIRMEPAQNRTTQGQKLVVSVRDDFQNAASELKHLYPRFHGRLEKAALLRHQVPLASPPPRQ